MRSLYSSRHDWLHPACKVLQKNKIQALSPHSWWCDWWLSHGEKLPEMLGSSITSWILHQTRKGGVVWSPGLWLARMLKHGSSLRDMTWVDRKSSGRHHCITLSGICKPGEFMKCAEDVTLVPIHFINELLRKLMSRLGPWRCPGTCLRGTKYRGE